MPEKLKKRVKITKCEDIECMDLENFPVRYGGTVPDEEFIGMNKK